MVKYLLPRMLESGFTKSSKKTEKIVDFIILIADLYVFQNKLKSQQCSNLLRYQNSTVVCK